MTLTEAKHIGDNPAGFPVDVLLTALERLESTRNNGGMKNSERATDRLEQRLERLLEEIHK